jgi:hypothetical protein
VRNLQRNLIDLPESLPLHRNASNAAIVCGAGPSLERIVPLLGKTREKVLLVSVDTALPILEMHGFTPDVVVALEGQLYNAYDFLPVSDRTGYTFVADLSSNPVAAELHQGTSWVLSMFDELPLLRRVARLRGIRSILPPLGSVGVAALALAQTVTNGPILMSGLDFAVTAGNTHARGAPAQTTGLASATRAAPVRDRGVEVSLHVGPGYGNGAVLTTPILKGYARDVENVAVPHRCHVVEPMGLSTRVPAIGVRPASELIEEACKLPSPPQGLNPDHPAHNGDDRFRDVYSFIHNEIQLLDRLLSARDDTERQERFSLCDYVACDLQGGRESIHNDPFWQRVRINAEYFRSRWKLTQELMNQRR